MRLLCIPVQPEPGLAEALTAEGFELDVRAAAESPASATATLAASLRATETNLAGAAAVLLTGTGDEALGAALAAVKLGIPTCWLRPADASVEEDLIGRVADLTLAATDDAAAASLAIRELAAPKLSSP